jgi:hypothetical protein
MIRDIEARATLEETIEAGEMSPTAKVGER